MWLCCLFILCYIFLLIVFFIIIILYFIYFFPVGMYCFFLVQLVCKRSRSTHTHTRTRFLTIQCCFFSCVFRWASVHKSFRHGHTINMGCLTSRPWRRSSVHRLEDPVLMSDECMDTIVQSNFHLQSVLLCQRLLCISQ